MKKSTTVLALTLVLSATLVLSLTGCSQKSSSSLPGSDSEIEEGVLAEFDKIAAVPRPSGHEEKIGAYLMQWATEHGFTPQQDGVGNVIFDIPATTGYENAPLTILQGHMDMVFTSDDSTLDPLTTPIKTVRNGNELKAEGTSLGADDGVGLATIMQYITSPSSHGPLRVLVTVNEENGMTGASHVDASTIADAKYFLNIDGEDSDEAIISCAGNRKLVCTNMDVQRVSPTYDTALKVSIVGGMGGHSGNSIDQKRVNAIVTLGTLLATFQSSGISFELASFEGGTANNAIPPSADAIITVSSADVEELKQMIANFSTGLASAYRASDPDIAAVVADASMPETVFSANQTQNVIDFTSLSFDGVYTMSKLADDLVESSSNLGIITANDQKIYTYSCLRSSEAVLLDELALRESRLAEICGLTPEISAQITPWPLKTDTQLQNIAQSAFKSQTGQDLKLVSLHASVECGEFIAANPDLDIICLGPRSIDGHSTSETLYIDSIVPCYRLIQGILAQIAEE